MVMCKLFRMEGFLEAVNSGERGRVDTDHIYTSQERILSAQRHTLLTESILSWMVIGSLGWTKVPVHED